MAAMKLHIGSGLTLGDDIVTQAIAVVGKRGAGKTNTAVVLAEELIKARQHVVILDPVSVWWGLRLAKDGISEGLPITILGGDRGDIPLESGAGALVADLIVDEGVSCILDLGTFTQNEKAKFVADFAEHLYRRKAKNREPLHVILDEAQRFAPQRRLYPGEERMLGAIEQLFLQARARGVGGTMITQRPAILNKNILTQVDALIALQLVAPQDKKAVDEWIQDNGSAEARSELMAQLPRFEKGQAAFWAPGWMETFKVVQVRERETFDSSRSPQRGDVHREPKQLPPAALEAFRKKMAATIERV
jgi:DNA helicase HerA-like ATPase